MAKSRDIATPSDTPDNGNGGTNPIECPKTDKVFDDCNKGFAKDRDAAQSGTRVGYTHYQTSEAEFGTRRELYDCSANAQERYLEFSHGTEQGSQKEGFSVRLAQDIKELMNCVEGATTQDSDLETKLKEAVKAIREAKDALKDMFDVACSLESCIDDSKNSEQLKVLTETIVENPQTQDKKFRDVIASIMSCAKTTKDYADTTFEASIKVYSLTGYNNVEVLSDKGKKLEQCVNAVTENIASNVEYNAKQIVIATDDLANSIVDMSTKDYALDKASGGWKALIDLIGTDYTAPIPEEDDLSPAGLKRLCEQAMQTFSSEVVTTENSSSTKSK